jgi:hypothetical protein
MNKKYERYINYIVNDIEPPYFNYMKDAYGLKQEEMVMVLSKVYNQPVTIKGKGNWVYNTNGNIIYFEDSDGYWYKKEFDQNGNLIYYESSNGDWVKYEYDVNGNETYFENSNGVIVDKR